MASIGSDVYIVGGITTVQPNQTSVPSPSQAQAYNTLSNAWSDIAHLPTLINHCNMASVGDRLYVLGGLRGDLVWDRIGDNFYYTPETDEWTRLPNMPAGTERGASAVGVWLDIIFLAGGLSYLSLVNGTQPTVSTVSAFNTRTNDWCSLPPLPEARDHVGAAVIGDTFYVVGGRLNGRTGVRGTVYALDLNVRRKEWAVRREMTTPRGGLATVAVGDRIYTFGGEGDPDVLDMGLVRQSCGERFIFLEDEY